MKTIEELAREAGFLFHFGAVVMPREVEISDLRRFAALVAWECMQLVVKDTEQLVPDAELLVRRRADAIRSAYPMPNG